MATNLPSVAPSLLVAPCVADSCSRKTLTQQFQGSCRVRGNNARPNASPTFRSAHSPHAPLPHLLLKPTYAPSLSALYDALLAVLCLWFRYTYMARDWQSMNSVWVCYSACDTITPSVPLLQTYCVQWAYLASLPLPSRILSLGLLTRGAPLATRTTHCVSRVNNSSVYQNRHTAPVARRRGRWRMKRRRE